MIQPGSAIHVQPRPDQRQRRLGVDRDGGHHPGGHQAPGHIQRRRRRATARCSPAAARPAGRCTAPARPRMGRARCPPPESVATSGCGTHRGPSETAQSKRAPHHPATSAATGREGRAPARNPRRAAPRRPSRPPATVAPSADCDTDEAGASTRTAGARLIGVGPRTYLQLAQPGPPRPWPIPPGRAPGAGPRRLPVPAARGRRDDSRMPAAAPRASIRWTPAMRRSPPRSTTTRARGSGREALRQAAPTAAPPHRFPGRPAVRVGGSQPTRRSSDRAITRRPPPNSSSAQRAVTMIDGTRAAFPIPDHETRHGRHRAGLCLGCVVERDIGSAAIIPETDNGGLIPPDAARAATFLEQPLLSSAIRWRWTTPAPTSRAARPRSSRWTTGA